MKVIGLVRLVRLPNLLMVALTMYLMRWSVIKPILMVQNLDLQVSEIAFLVLVLSTLLITAAGYAINDYHDVKADRFNEPEKVVIDRLISRRQALLFHWLLNFSGVIAGSVYSLIYHVPWMIIAFVGAPVLLWYYSFRLKHIMIIGNLTVSFLAASVPLLVLFFEFPLINRNYSNYLPFIPDILRTLSFWIGMFSFFACATNMIMEIIKNAGNIRGDMESGSKTLPLAYGLKKARLIAVILSILTLLVIAFVFLRYLTDWISLGFFVIFLFVPFIILIIKLFKANKKEDFFSLSQLVKLIMLFGLLYAPVAQWLIGKMFNS